MAIEHKIVKDPESVTFRDLDWLDELGGESIIASEWSVSDNGITIDSDSFTINSTRVWMSGGVDGNVCYLKNKVTTDGGQILVRRVEVTIEPR